MRRLKVVAVAPWFPSQKKPGAGAFHERDALLIGLDHDVTVVHLADPGDFDPEEPRRYRTDAGLTVIRVPFRPYDPRSMRAAVAGIRNELRSSDLVHSMALHTLVPVRLARPTVPWVHTEHWSGLLVAPSSLKKRIGLLAYRSSLASPDAVVSVSRALAESVAQHRKGRVHVIGNQVTVGEPDDRPEAPEQRGSSALRLVGVGRLIQGKGTAQAIDTVAELRGRGIDVSLEWIGPGPLRDELTQHIRRLGLQDAVRLLGEVRPETVPALLRQAHVFVLPTESETYGIALAEALGQGLPVVTSGSGGHVDFLPPEASRLVERRTGSAIADAIESLIVDPNRWDAATIMEYARARFSEQSRREDYAEVYESVLT